MYPAGNLFIPATHGRLEAIYRPKSNQAERAALVLHPHPLHGGTMHNKVVFRAAKALNECGFETLRFNFRGVGLSAASSTKGAANAPTPRSRSITFSTASRTRAKSSSPVFRSALSSD